jgi:hypothetical protein
MAGRGIIGLLAGTAVVLAACGATTPAPTAAFQNVMVLRGRADAAESGLSITTEDWTYGGGYGFRWVDAVGTWHDDGRPDCLPVGTSRVVTFAATVVMVDGSTWRPIVWLDCR